MSNKLRTRLASIMELASALPGGQKIVAEAAAAYREATGVPSVLGKQGHVEVGGTHFMHAYNKNNDTHEVHEFTPKTGGGYSAKVHQVGTYAKGKAMLTGKAQGSGAKWHQNYSQLAISALPTKKFSKSKGSKAMSAAAPAPAASRMIRP